MPGPMQGIKVVEVGMWVAGPAAAGILGDWGADVIKIEPPEGDPFRGVLARSRGGGVGARRPGGGGPPRELGRRRDKDRAAWGRSVPGVAVRDPGRRHPAV